MCVNIVVTYLVAYHFPVVCFNSMLQQLWTTVEVSSLLRNLGHVNIATRDVTTERCSSVFMLEHNVYNFYKRYCNKLGIGALQRSKLMTWFAAAAISWVLVTLLITEPRNAIATDWSLLSQSAPDCNILTRQSAEEIITNLTLYAKTVNVVKWIMNNRELFTCVRV